MVTGPDEAEGTGLTDAEVAALDDVTTVEAEELLLGETTLRAAEEVCVLVGSAVGTLAVPLASAAGFSAVD